MYTATASDHLYATWGFPLGVALLGVALCLAGGLVAALQVERRDAPAPWLWGLLGIPISGALLVALGLAPPLLTRLYSASHAALDSAGPLPGRVFQDLIAGELLAWVAAVGLGCLGLWVRALREGRPELPALTLPGSLLVAGLALALAGLGHRTALLAWGPLPTLRATDGARVHVGRSLDLTPALEGTPHPERCRLAPALFAPEAPGPATLPLQATCGLIRAERTLSVEGGEDRAPDGLPLASGNRWTWRHMRDWHNQHLWFIPERGHAEGPDLHLLVTGVEEEGPLRSTTLREWVETEPGGTPSEERTHRAYAWNGELLVLSDEGPTAEPFFALLEPPEGATLGEGEGLCTIGVFPHMTCRCLAAPEGQALLPGPSICEPDPSLGDDIRALGSVFLAVITVGLVIVDPDQDPRWVLVGSGAQ